MIFKNFLKNNIYLILISLFLLITRIYKIDTIPSSVYWDEASIGYNAYSVITTGSDEWGSFLPLHFRAFGEFKLPVYIYSVATLVKLIGLNEFAVRLPAVLYGLGSLVLIYLLAYKITKNKLVSNLASFIFAVMPWFFIFSRTGYEVTAGLFFYLAGVYFLILGLEINKLFLFGVISLLASLYSYTSFRIVAPLTLFAFLFELLRNKSKYKFIVIIISVAIFIVSLIPVVKLFVYDAGFGRAQTFALIPGFQQVYDLQGKPHFQVTFNREGISWTKNIYQMASNYFSHFSYDFLFVNGDSNSRSQVPNSEQLLLVSFPFLVLGFFNLLKSKYKYSWVIFLTFLLAPIPAAITKESPHALRAVLLVFSFSITTALGIVYAKERIKNLKYQNLFLMATIFVFVISFSRYYLNFLNNYNNQIKNDWQYEYKEIFKVQNSGCIEDKYGQPYIFGLYYKKVDPKYFLETRELNDVSDWGFSTVKSFGEYKFLKKCE